jgi:flagellar biosynthesis protein FlhA
MTIETLAAEHMYTSEEVTEYLRVSLRTTQRLLKGGELRSFKVHGQYRIKGIDLINYLHNVRSDSTEIDESENKPADLLPLLKVAPLAIEISTSLIPLFQSSENSLVLKGLEDVRKQIIHNLGFIFPGIQINDNHTLLQDHFQILVHGSPVKYAHGQGATEAQMADQILQQLQATAQQYAHEILSREEVALMVENLRQTHRVVVDEVMQDGFETHPQKLTIGQLTRVLKGLLREQVSIRNLRLILEGLADGLEMKLSGDALIEQVRQTLTRQICSTLIDAPLTAGSAQVISVITLEQALEQILIDAVQTDAWGHTNFVLDSALSRGLLAELKDVCQNSTLKTIICSPLIRSSLRRMIARHFPAVAVLSYLEIDTEFKIRAAASLQLPG